MWPDHLWQLGSSKLQSWRGEAADATVQHADRNGKKEEKGKHLFTELANCCYHSETLQTAFAKLRNEKNTHQMSNVVREVCSFENGWIKTI